MGQYYNRKKNSKKFTIFSLLGAILELISKDNSKGKKW